MNLQDALETSLSSLAAHKLRSILTMLGIVFGVGAVIAMLSIGAGAERQALETISRLGLHNVLVRAKNLSGEALREARENSPGLSLRDVEAIRDAIPGVELVAPKLSLEPYQVLSAEASTKGMVHGVGAEYARLSNLELSEGRFLDLLDVRDHSQVAVIGDQIRRDLFGHGTAIRRLLKVNDIWLEVIGVLAAVLGGEGDSFQGVTLGSSSSAIYVPVTTALRKFDREPLKSPLSEVVVRLEEPETGRITGLLVDELLRRLHAGEEDYELIVPEELLAEKQRTQRMFNIVMGCIAGISLLVGGIGIMNIMLASVLERTREIGLRRAMGAKRRDILFQFLVESFALSAIGGLTGIIMGIAIARLVAASVGWMTIITVWSVVLSTSVAVAVGLASGIYPAIRAAELDPITSLRYE